MKRNNTPEASNNQGNNYHSDIGLEVNKLSLCFGEYDNDPFGHCFGCMYSLPCAIKTYGDD